MPEYEKDANELAAKFQTLREQIDALEEKLNQLEALEAPKPFRIPFMNGERW